MLQRQAKQQKQSFYIDDTPTGSLYISNIDANFPSFEKFLI